MKNLILVVLLAFAFGLECFSEKMNPILDTDTNGTYTPEFVKNFALSHSKKAHEYRLAVVSLVQRKLNEAGIDLILSEESIGWIFSHVQIQEVWLEAGQWKNSGWMPNEQRIKFYVSDSRYEDNAGIFVYEKDGKYCSFPLYKETCGNLFDIVALAYKPNAPHSILIPDSVYSTSGRIDTVYKVIWTVEIREVQIHTTQVTDWGYQPMFIPYYNPWMGWGYSNNYSCQGICYNNVVNNNTIINNNVTTIDNNWNYTWNDGQRVTPQPHVDPPNGRTTPPPHVDPPGGGRVTPRPHTDLVSGANTPNTRSQTGTRQGSEQTTQRSAQPVTRNAQPSFSGGNRSSSSVRPPSNGNMRSGGNGSSSMGMRPPTGGGMRSGGGNRR